VSAWLWTVVVLVVLGVVALVLLGRGSSARVRTRRQPSGRDVPGPGRTSPRDDEHAPAGAHREALEIRPLGGSERREYAARWEATRAMFVDSPQAAVAEADVLARAAMARSGYPVGGDDRRLADASLEHPDVMDHFRLATPIAAEARTDRASPEGLRQAMVHYRELFAHLLGDDPAPTAPRRIDAPDADGASANARAETPETPAD
jgi:hypothetical protein